jgi:hypothetical protein
LKAIVNIAKPIISAMGSNWERIERDATSETNLDTSPAQQLGKN